MNTDYETNGALRELDIDVVTKIFGCHFVHFPAIRCTRLVTHEYFERCTADGVAIEGRVEPVDNASDIPHYTSDMSSAWYVVEALHARGFGFNLRYVDDHANASFEFDATGEAFASVTDVSAPKAIVCAALLAVAMKDAA